VPITLQITLTSRHAWHGRRTADGTAGVCHSCCCTSHMPHEQSPHSPALTATLGREAEDKFCWNKHASSLTLCAMYTCADTGCFLSLSCHRTRTVLSGRRFAPYEGRRGGKEEEGGENTCLLLPALQPCCWIFPPVLGCCVLTFLCVRCLLQCWFLWALVGCCNTFIFSMRLLSMPHSDPAAHSCPALGAPNAPVAAPSCHTWPDAMENCRATAAWRTAAGSLLWLLHAPPVPFAPVARRAPMNSKRCATAAYAAATVSLPTTYLPTLLSGIRHMDARRWHRAAHISTTGCRSVAHSLRPLASRICGSGIREGTRQGKDRKPAYHIARFGSAGRTVRTMVRIVPGWLHVRVANASADRRNTIPGSPSATPCWRLHLSVGRCTALPAACASSRDGCSARLHRTSAPAANTALPAGETAGGHLLSLRVTLYCL